jgi:dTMP kinase
MNKGKFVVLEGIDKSGKTTVSGLIMEHLIRKGVSSDMIIQIRYPNRDTLTGKLLDSYLKSETELCPEAVHLIFSANRWETKDYILKMKNEGKIVICDRYYHSGIVYSMTKGLKYKRAKQADYGLPEPDHIFFIDVSPEKVRKRENYGDERYEKLAFQNKIYKNYKKILKKNGNVAFIDGKQNLNQIMEDIVERILKEVTLN